MEGKRTSAAASLNPFGAEHCARDRITGDGELPVVRWRVLAGDGRERLLHCAGEEEESRVLELVLEQDFCAAGEAEGGVADDVDGGVGSHGWCE